jgi:hypothetical protein
MTMNAEARGLQQQPRGTVAWFFGLLALMLLIAPMVPGLPLAVPLAALATPVRNTRWVMVSLWVLAALYALGMAMAIVSDIWPAGPMLDEEDSSRVG